MRGKYCLTGVMMLLSLNVWAQACVVELKIPQIGIHDKSCHENHNSPKTVFNALCDSHRKEQSITVTDLTWCPKGYLAYCEFKHPDVTGTLRTYTYSAQSVASLKQSCHTNTPGIVNIRWVQP